MSTSYTYCSAGCDGNSPTNSTVNGGIGRVTFNDNGTTNMVNVAASQGVVCTSGCEGNSPTLVPLVLLVSQILTLKVMLIMQQELIQL